MAHEFPLRVYYEDTDFGGVVYYANYLKFIERGRSEWLRALGFDQKALKSDQGLVFAVRRVLADYLRPGLFDDALVVRTRLVTLGGARLDLWQEVLRGDELLFTAEVTLVCMSLDGKAARMPEALRAAFG
jgi:acyl-CoA thioester hydrolase